MKITPKVDVHSTIDALLPPDEAPGQRWICKLVGIMMNELWEVVECQTTFLDMNHQMDAVEWPPIDQK